jgi:hypothetical protein
MMDARRSARGHVRQASTEAPSAHAATSPTRTAVRSRSAIGIARLCSSQTVKGGRPQASASREMTTPDCFFPREACASVADGCASAWGGPLWWRW